MTRVFIIGILLILAENANAQSNPPAPGAGQFSHDKQSQATSPKEGADHNQSGTQENPFIIEIAKPEQEDGRAYDKSKDADQKAANERLFYTTCILAFFAFLQWLIYCGQGYLMWRSVRISEKALTDLERPYVFFQVKKNGMTINRTSDIGLISIDEMLIYSFINQGRSPAILTEYICKPVICEQGYPEPINPEGPRPAIDGPNQFPAGVAIASKKSYTSPINIKDWFPGENDDWNKFAKTSDNRSRFFLIGYIKYRDILGYEHITGYLAYFDYFSECFRLIGDERYNYTKTYKIPRSLKT